MRTMSLIAMATLAWCLMALHARAPSRPGMAAAPPTSPAAATAPAVHATTEDDLDLIRRDRPSWNGAPIAGLRMRWCVAEGRCR